MKYVSHRVGLCMLVISLAMLSGVTCYSEFGPQPLACMRCTPSVPEGMCKLSTEMNSQIHDTLMASSGKTVNVTANYMCLWQLGEKLPNGDCVPTTPIFGSFCYVVGHYATGEDCADPS